MFETLSRLVNPIHRSWLTYGHFVTDALAPPVCVLCGGSGRDGRACDPPGPWGLDLCTWCEQACRHVPLACPRCGQPRASEQETECADCRARPPPFQATWCLFAYGDPADRLVTALKFEGRLACARVLGMLMAEQLRARARPLPDCVIPLPSHASRHRERGFCHTSEIARHLLRRLGARATRPPVRTDLLRRIRATRVQSGLSAGERASNLQGAFAVPAGQRPPPRVALLDDVMTTGHTAAAAARALRAAGSEQVEVWCCARALRP